MLLLLIQEQENTLEEKVKKNNNLNENQQGESLSLNLEELKELFNLLKECKINEFELEKPGLKIKIKQGAERIVQVSEGIELKTQAEKSVLPIEVIEKTKPIDESLEEEKIELHYITSPMVGTFYRAPSPGAEPFVDIGDKIKAGQVVGIIEAMKIMNEIEADVDGEVVAIYVGNAEPVEFGQKIIALKPIRVL